MDKKSLKNISIVSALLVVSLLFILLGNIQAAKEEGEDTKPITILSDNNPESIKPGEIEFQEIELSPEGVIAYDSSGNKWSYDFINDQFVIGDESRERRGGDEGREKIEIVNLRCIEELFLSSPEIDDISVGYDEFVNDDIYALGKVVVRGWVKGNIHSYNKKVIVTSTGQVDGDITSPTILVKEGGIVIGKQHISNRLTFPKEIFARKISSAGFWVIFAFTITFILISFIFTSLAPRQFDNMCNCIHNNKVKTTLLGLLFVILMPLTITLVAITIIGILAIALLPILLLIVMTLAICNTGRVIHTAIFSGRKGGVPGWLPECLMGIAIHMLPWLSVAYLLTRSVSSDSAVHGFGIFLLVVSILFSSYSLLAGIGAALLTRFGFRSYVSFSTVDGDIHSQTERPVPPPMPKAPSIPGPKIQPPTKSIDPNNDSETGSPPTDINSK